MGKQDGTKNLIPLTMRDPETAAAIRAAGGRAAGPAKRKMKNMRQAARFILEAGLQAEDAKTAAALETLGLEPDQQSAILFAAANKARTGDIEAARFIRDTSGQAPAQAVDIKAGSGTAEDLRNLSTAQLEEMLQSDLDHDN